MQSRDKSFIEFFTNNTYLIPEYQRPYEWEDSSHISDFWQDLYQQLNDFNESSNYDQKLFLGVVILEEVPKKIDTYQVVDGQQRITTLFILLVAIEQILKKLASIKKEYSKEITTDYFDGYNLINMQSNIRQLISTQDDKGSTSKIHFQAHALIEKLMNYICTEGWDRKFINKKFKSQKNVKKVFDYFEERLNELVGIKYETVTTTVDGKEKKNKKLIDISQISPEKITKLIKALRSIMFITLTVPTREEAYELFERVNARGKELDVGDLLKNHLFSQGATLINDGEEETTSLEEAWREILENCDEKVLRLLKYFHTTLGGYCTNKKLYRKLKSISQNDKPDNLLKGLYDYSKYTKYIKKCKDVENTKNYLNTLIGDEEDKSKYYKSQLREITESIKGLDCFGVTQYQPVFYSVVTKFHKLNLFNDEKLRKYISRFIELIENYHFVNTLICETVGHDIEKLYANSAQEINQAKNKKQFLDSVQNLVDTLHGQLNTREVFITNYKELDYTKTPYSTLYYIFDRMNSYDLIGKRVKRLVDARWMKIYEKGKGYKRTDTTAEHWRNRSESAGVEKINNIGNLIYLTRDINSTKINALKTSEKPAYFQDNPQDIAGQGQYLPYFLNKYKDRISIWNDEDIDNHAEDQAMLAYDTIWKFNPDISRKP